MLIEDTAFLLAQSQQDWASRGPCARAAALNATLLIESAANACIAATPKSIRKRHRAHSEASEKFEAFLGFRNGTQWDRSHPAVCDALEVLQIRHFLAHPAPRRGTAEINERGFVADFGQFPRLQIPYAPRGWSHADASKIARAATAFLKVYFIDWCGMSKGDVIALLIAWDAENIDGSTMRSLIVTRQEFETIEREIPDALGFLDLRWIDYDKLLAEAAE